MSQLLFSEEVNYGLFLHSYPANNADWSELEIEEGKSFNLKTQFSIQFDIYVRDECPFGYIFRAYDKTESIDLFFTVGDNDERYPAIKLQDSIYLFNNELIRNKWITVKLDIDKSKHTVEILFDNEKKLISNYKSKAKNIDFIFGKSTIKGFETKDIASINIRDIIIESNHKITRHWPLKKHYNNISYDEINGIPAITKNASWLIDNHITLKPIFIEKFKTAPSVAFDSEKGNFYLINSSENILVFNIDKQIIDTLKVEEGNFVTSSPNQLIYIQDFDHLVSYSVDKNIYSYFNFDTGSWSDNSNKYNYTYEHNYWNNSANYYPKDSSIISFGGYGHYRFNNNLVTLKPLGQPSSSNIVNLSNISPRCSSASTIVGDTLYIFGGRGSQSGQQELSPQNFYDFYAVNLKTYEVKKLWNIESLKGSNFLPGENLIYDKEQNCFYSFITQTGGKIAKLNAHDNTIIDVSLKLDIDITEQYLYINLYYSPTLKSFYVLINRINVDNSSEVSIYSIKAPLIQVNSVIIEKAKSGLNYTMIIAVLIFLSLIFIFFYIRLNKRNKAFNSTVEKIDNDNHEVYLNNTPKNIYLLGSFQIIDRTGTDISADFTPTLRNIFVLLLIFTQQKNGISGIEMIRILWPDKEEESAKNSRNVYLSKLRTLLDKIGGFRIINKNQIWSLEIDDDLKCDYIEAYKYLKNKDEKELNLDQIHELISILSRGPLLQAFEFECLDQFKNDFSNKTIDILYTFLDYKAIEDILKLKICDILFLHDFLNERALFYKCGILNKFGKKGIAKNVYDSFFTDYKSVFGINYNKSFVEVLRSKEM